MLNTETPARPISDVKLREILDELKQEPSSSDDALAAVEREQARLIQTSRVVIVDDEPINIKLVRKVLQEVGYLNLTGVTDSTTAIESIREEKADIVLLDLMMPKVSGLDILEQMQDAPDLKGIPVVVLTASTDRETKLRALELGANDFLGKPVDRAELIPRVRNILAMKAHYDGLQGYTQRLEEAFEARKQELASAEVAIVHCLARAAEFRDDVTGRHVTRVGRYSGLLAKQLGFDADYVHRIELAAQLHDVGKIGVPDSILQKPGKLDANEYLDMQKHCSFGRRVLETSIEQKWDDDRHPSLGGEILSAACSPMMKMAARIAITHHEYWDGSGYPLGLEGTQIPIEGRIVAVADVLDAMSSARPYKPAFPISQCLEEMVERSGTQFDPQVIDALLCVKNQIAEIRINYADTEGPGEPVADNPLD